MITSFALVALNPMLIQVQAKRRAPEDVSPIRPMCREPMASATTALEAIGWAVPKDAIIAFDPVPFSSLGLDIAVAGALLEAASQLNRLFPDGAVLAGSLESIGRVHHVRGAAAFALIHPNRTLICSESMADLVVAMGGTAIGIQTIEQLLDLPEVRVGERRPVSMSIPTDRSPDFPDLHVNRAVLDQLADAALTRQPVLLIEPPGCGKTMLAARCPGLLPDLTVGESQMMLAIRDAAGFAVSGEDPLAAQRPFRAPHHSVKLPGLIGGAAARPGEASLADGGVLFLDELPQFEQATLEGLYAVLDKGFSADASGTFSMPARPWLVMAANPCLCGRAGAACSCTTEQQVAYEKRLLRMVPKNTRVIQIPVRISTADTLSRMVQGVSPSAVTLREAALARAEEADRAAQAADEASRGPDYWDPGMQDGSEAT